MFQGLATIALLPEITVQPGGEKTETPQILDYPVQLQDSPNCSPPAAPLPAPAQNIPLGTTLSSLLLIKAAHLSSSFQ